MRLLFTCLFLCWLAIPSNLQDEIAKRAARAKKFGLPEERQAPSYAPDPEDLKREARAKKFGVKYEKPTPDTLLQKQGEPAIGLSQ
jgi:hypothetical protein